MNLFDAATDLASILQAGGHRALFVGGCVRDKLLHLPLSDIDIATSASSEIVQQLFPKTIPVGIKFGIVIVVHKGHHFEVASFRKDRPSHNNRHPTAIEPATLEEDVQRRDFTINGLYYDPITDQLIDLVEGQQDLKNRLVRAIGDPIKRFEEDHLRMMRACRYAAVLNFTLESNTKEAICTMAPYISETLSVERIVQELEKMHRKNALATGLNYLQHYHLLKYLFPEFERLDEFTLHERIKKVALLDKTDPLILALMILFEVRNEAALKRLVALLKLSNAALTIGEAALSWQRHKHLSRLELAQLLSLPYSASLIKKQSLDEPTSFLMAISALQKELSSVITRIETKNPLVSAHDLIERGVPKGPRIKALMQQAMMLLADNPSLSKEEVLALLEI